MLTPDQWRQKLSGELRSRAADIDLRHRYYSGDHPMPTAPNTRNEAYKRLARLAQLNLTQLVVDAKADRLEPTGLTFGDEPANDVWRDVWQANDLDEWAGPLHQEALISRRAYTLVWPTADDVSITPELPTEMVTAHHPGDPKRRPIAALKEYRDLDGSVRSVLWLPETVHFWITQSNTQRASAWEDGVTGVLLGSTVEAGAVAANPMGMVPVTEFLARPNLAGVPAGEITTGVMRIQDRINKTLLDRLVAAEFVAFPQRYVIGVEELDAEGKPRTLESGPERSWLFPDDPSDVRIGQLDAADLTPHLNAVKADVEALSAVSKTPMFLLAASLSNVGLETVSAFQEGLVKTVESYQRSFGAAYERTIRLALAAKGDPRAADLATQVEWADAASHTDSEIGDWAIKVKDILPRSEVWKRMGYSPQDIDRMEAEMPEAERDGRSLSAAEIAQKVYLAVNADVLTRDEARALIAAAGAALTS